MKKIISAAICIVLLLTGCSLKPDALDANYVGEGQMTLLKYLIKSNGFLVEDVFVESHLPTESGKDITNESGTYALVASDEIGTYDELRTTLEATYTKEAADKILSQSDRYAEIDGKLYFNTKYAESDAEDYDWNKTDIKVISVANGTYELEVSVKKVHGLKQKFTVKAVTVDGDIRLENMFY